VGLLLTGVVVLGGASAAHACSCVPRTHREELAEAAAVFTGELTSLVPARVEDLGLVEHAFRFEVDEVFRGQVGPTAEVLSLLGSAACGLDARVGQRWFVIADRDERHPDELVTSYCTATQRLTGATPHFVGVGHPPDPAVAAPPDRTVDTTSLAVMVLAGGAAAIALTTGIVRRRRPKLV
jgi:hypothetical protein